ncbi:MAG: M14 family metallocarboxypeptidase [Pseudomonadota bacterium]|nr:M14 family metallocarboxypeptidase [Pseudomonadota bacterium]
MTHPFPVRFSPAPWRPRLHALAAALALLAAASAQAQYDPAKVQVQPAAVAARFPAIAHRYDTPGFSPWQSDFTSHAQMMARLQALQERPSVRLESAGTSVQGRSLPVVLLAEGGRWRPERPTLLLVAHQHGNEPATGEAALVLLERWSAPESAELLRAINIVALPRANPDGAALFTRANADGLDLNRDHLLLRTPEARVMAQVATRYRPHVVLDLHEYTAGDRWVSKFKAWTKHDVLLQSATTANLDAGLARLGQDVLLPAMRQAVQAEGLSEYWYHTTSADPNSPVAMGGVQPDTWRNIGGLRHAVSLLLETRGIGLGKQHLDRRVHGQVVAAQAVAQQVAARGAELLALRQAADRATVAQACQGEIAVAASQTPEQRELPLIDADTGADKNVPVQWRSSLALRVTQSRARPCGYWLAPGETQAVNTLRALGVQVQPLARTRAIQAERYLFKNVETGQRQDGRGAIRDAGGIVKAQVDLQPAQVRVPAGGWYVSLAQPLAGLVTAALEPDSQNSYVAARLIGIAQQGEPDRLLRVMQPLR